MQNFDFCNPTHIIFGKDRLGDIDAQVPADARVMITYGGGSAKKSGLIEKVKAALGKRTVFEFNGIEANPQYETLMKAVEFVRKEKIDFIMAVGGGSAIDGTKFICLASHYHGDARDLLKFGFKQITAETVARVVPFATVLTLPATGSEMNCGAVISHEHSKFVVMSALVYPKFSVLDPTYTFTLPEVQVANGIVDAFVHTCEQYLTFPANGRLQDRMAEGILLTLIEIGVTAVREPENYDIRADQMWSATMALNGLIAVGMPQDWATHMIGHELTAMFGIDHGQTLAVVYPAMLEVRRAKKHAKLLQYASRVWGIENGSDDEKIDAVIAKTRAFFESLGIKTRLSQHGVMADKIPAVIQQLEEHGMTVLSETGDLTLDIAKTILEKAM